MYFKNGKYKFIIFKREFESVKKHVFSSSKNFANKDRVTVRERKRERHRETERERQREREREI
jgi:hypothetical protein